ncbi:MAG: hypothetical protein RLZZ502_1512 [Pseudomonadota bacterium]|jgi:hypothetical protein
MSAQFIIRPLVLGLLAVGMSACIVHPVGHGRAVVAPVPAVAGAIVAGAIAASVVGGVTYVNTAPPTPVYENYGYAPAPGMVWTPGYHYWDGRAYVWRGGVWAHPPRPGAVYTPGRWVRHSHGHHWVHGSWR